MRCAERARSCPMANFFPPPTACSRARGIKPIVKRPSVDRSSARARARGRKLDRAPLVGSIGQKCARTMHRLLCVDGRVSKREAADLEAAVPNSGSACYLEIACTWEDDTALNDVIGNESAECARNGGSEGGAGIAVVGEAALHKGVRYLDPKEGSPAVGHRHAGCKRWNAGWLVATVGLHVNNVVRQQHGELLHRAKLLFHERVQDAQLRVAHHRFAIEQLQRLQQAVHARGSISVTDVALDCTNRQGRTALSRTVNCRQRTNLGRIAQRRASAVRLNPRNLCRSERGTTNCTKEQRALRCAVGR
eukprot:4306801-Prymnesium_polylepis.1